jgi:hypothetical protein
MVELVRQKNVATYIFLPILDKNGDTVSGAANVDAEYTYWDDGTAPIAFVNITDNSGTERDTTGRYYFSLTASEMNHDYIYIKITSTTANTLDQDVLIRTIVGDPLNLATTEAGRQIDVAAGGEVGVDFSNINGTLDAAEIGSNAITAAKIATDAIDNTKIAANSIGSSELADNAITAAKIAADAITNAKIATDAIGSDELAQSALDEINAEVDKALDTAIPGVPIADSINDIIKDLDAKFPTNNIMGSSVKTDKDDEIDAIKAKTDNLPADPASETNVDANETHLTDIKGTGFVKDTDSLTDIRPETDKIQTVLDDTNEMQGKLPSNNIMGSSVKTDKDDEIDAIKAKTDNLPVDPASETNVDANETHLTDIKGTGFVKDTDSLTNIRPETDKIQTIDNNVDLILADTNEMQGKLPTNNIMGSSVKTDKDDEIDAIKAKTDNLPADPTSETVATSNKNEIITDLDDVKGTGFVKDTDSLVNIRPETDKINAIKLKTDNLPTDPTSETNATTNKNDIITQIDKPIIVASCEAFPAWVTWDALRDHAIFIQAFLNNQNGGNILSGEITPGTITIYRFRNQVQTKIVDAVPTTAFLNGVLYTYTFTSANWAIDDAIIIQFDGISVTKDGRTVNIPTVSGASGIAGNDSKSATDSIVAKLPTNFLMGSSDQTDKDDEINAIKGKTDNLPSDPTSETVATSNKQAILDDHIVMKQKAAGSYDRETDSLEALSDAFAGDGKDWTDGEKEQFRDAMGIDGTKTPATGGQLQTIQEDIGDPSSNPALKSLNDMINVLLTGLTVGAGSIRIYGTALDRITNLPVPNIRVRGIDETTKQVYVQDITDENGEWNLFLDPATYIFEFAGEADNIDGYIKQDILGTVTPTPSEQEFQDVSLKEFQIDQGSGSEIVGWNGAIFTFGTEAIKDIGGNPLENVRVESWLQGDEQIDTNIQGRHKTDALGRYTLYLNPGDYVIKFTHPQFSPSSILITVT